MRSDATPGRRPAVIVALLALTLLLPVVVLAWASTSLASQAVSDQARATVRSAAVSNADYVGKEMSSLADVVQSYAGRPFLQAAFTGKDATNDNRAGFQSQLDALAESRVGIATTFLADNRGGLLAIKPATPSILGKDFSYRDWFRGVTATGRPYISEAYRSAATGHPLVTAAAAPVFDPDGKRLGVLVAGYSLETLQRFVDQPARGREIALTITDQHGTVLASSQRSGVSVSTLKKAAASGDDLVGRATVPGLRWTVTASESKQTAFASARELRRGVLALSVGLAVVILGGLWLQYRTLRARARTEAELVATSEELLAHRQRLQLTLEVGRINVWEVDAAGDMTMEGDRAGDYGSTMEAGLSTLRPEHAQQVRDGVEAVRHDGTPRDYEVQSARDGRWFAGRLMRSSPSRVTAVSVDVTALREAQDALRKSETKRGLDALAESERRGRYNALVIGTAAQGIAAIDRNGVCISANPAAARLLGYDVSELVGANLHELVHHSKPDGTPYPAAECELRQTARSGTSARVEDDVFWRDDGTRLRVSYTAEALKYDGDVRGAVVTFSDVGALRTADHEREQLAACLRQGIHDGELVLHYQPKINLLTGGCDAVEALVRWQRQDTLVYPDDFIPAAEACGVIGELTSWVVDEAAGQIAAWSRQGLDLRVAVNVSTNCLTDGHIVGELRKAAGSRHIPVSQLEVEITESAAAENPAVVIEVLAELAALRVRTAIDDFGTGFSSLSYLKNLPVSTLKIDKSFVMNMPNDTRDQAIVASTIHMAHSLGMSVVAEGVENDLVMRILRRAMCDAGQGYHWSRPVPAEGLTAWMAKSRDFTDAELTEYG